MAIKYLGNISAGQPLEIFESREVNLANEALDKPSAFEGETVIYTVTINDDHNEMLPSTFVADLEMDGVKIITGQVFDASVYDPITFLLTLPFIVPETLGSHIIKLIWAEQIL